MIRFRRLLSAAFAACLPAAAALAVTPETVEEAALEAFAKVDSFTCTVALEAELPFQTVMIPVTGAGEMHYLRDETGERFRQRIALELPETLAMTASVDILFDGAKLYLTNEMLGRKDVVESELNLKNGAVPPGGPLLFGLLNAHFGLEAEEDAEDEVWLLRGERKEDDDAELPFQSIELRIAQETGLVEQFVMIRASGDPGATVRYEDYAVNASVAPEIFDFAPPAAAAPEPVEEEDGAGGA